MIIKICISRKKHLKKETFVKYLKFSKNYYAIPSFKGYLIFNKIFESNKKYVLKNINFNMANF